MLAGLPQGTARGTNYCGPVTIPSRVREHVLHSLRAVCGFSYVPQELLCDTGPTVYRPYRGRLESLPFADVITKVALSSQLFKDPECWSHRGLNQWPLS